jgi:hypothetical protein
MSIILQGHVRSGRLVVDEPVDLPENTAVDVAVIESDEPDIFDANDRAQLDAAITAGKQALARGEVFSAEQVLSEL